MIKKIWSFYVRHNLKIGLILTIIGLWLTIKPPSQNPHLTYYYQSFDLVELKESNENLKIYFKGTDIEQTKQNLKVFSITLVNDGNSDVKIEDYDADYPFGLQIKNGFATGINIKADKKSYVGERFYRERNNDSTTILFNKIIIKSRQEIKFEITVIHKEGITPELIPMGKIANTNIDIEHGEVKKDFDWWMIPKILGIIALYLGGVVLFFAAIYWIGNIISYVNRKMRIKGYYGHHYDSHNKNHRVLVSLYIELGKDDFLEIMEIFKHDVILIEKYCTEIKNKILTGQLYKLYKESRISAKEFDGKYKSKLLDVVSVLEDAKLIDEKSDCKISINREFVNDLTDLLEYIKKDKTIVSNEEKI